MPRRAVQATTRRRDLRLSPELGEAQRRTDGSNRSRPPAPEDRRLKIRSSPSMQAPWSPRRGRELSRASLGEARRRQSRTGHGRTRHEGRPPGPPAYPPLSSRRSLWRRRHFEAEAIFDHRGRIAPPTPGALCSRSGVACQEGRRNFIARRRIRRSRPAERTVAIRAERPLRPAHPQKKPVQARPLPARSGERRRWAPVLRLERPGTASSPFAGKPARPQPPLPASCGGKVR
jgi:hypothetical protein